eukprot:1160579-Pelagomonas_calceolata.AAC.3
MREWATKGTPTVQEHCAQCPTSLPSLMPKFDSRRGVLGYTPIKDARKHRSGTHTHHERTQTHYLAWHQGRGARTRSSTCQPLVCGGCPSVWPTGRPLARQPGKKVESKGISLGTQQGKGNAASSIPKESEAMLLLRLLEKERVLQRGVEFNAAAWAETWHQLHPNLPLNVITLVTKQSLLLE